jgi:hypothetical protein
MNSPTAHRLGAIVCTLALAVAAAPARAQSTFPGGEYLAGSISILFGEHGSLRVKSSGKPLVDAVYSTHADEIRITDRSGPMACTGKGTSTGLYRWKYADDTLALTKLDDSCEGRVQDLTVQPWKRKK